MALLRPDIMRLNPLTDEQRSVLDENNTLLSNGITLQHARIIQHIHDEYQRDSRAYLIETQEDEALRAEAGDIDLNMYLSDSRKRLDDERASISRGIGAEAFYAFGLQLGGIDTAANISLIKVTTEFGDEIPDTDLGMGYVDMAGNHFTNDDMERAPQDFTKADLQLAIARLQVQHAVGLDYYTWSSDQASKLSWVFEQA